MSVHDRIRAKMQEAIDAADGIVAMAKIALGTCEQVGTPFDDETDELLGFFRQLAAKLVEASTTIDAELDRVIALRAQARENPA